MAGKQISNLSVILSASVSPFVTSMGKAGAAAALLGSSVSSAFSKIESSVASLASPATALLGSVTSLLGPMTAVAGGMLLAQGASWALGKAFTSLTDGIKLAAQLEQMSVAFETIFGSATKAKGVMLDLKAFAAATPFEFPELASSAKLLAAFGTAADQITPTLKVLGDIASGVGAPLQDLAGAYGKVRTAGKLTGETLDMFNSKGVPLLATMAQQAGVTTAEMQKMISAGSVGFPQVQKALASLTGPGGQFADMMQKQSGTLAGLWSTLTDNVQMAFAGVAQTVADAFHFKDALAALIDFTGRAGDWINGAVAKYAPMFMSAGQRVVAEVKTTWDSIYAYVAPAASQVADFIGHTWQAALTSTADAFWTAYKAVSSFAKSAVETVTPFIKAAFSADALSYAVSALKTTVAVSAAAWLGYRGALVAATGVQGGLRIGHLLASAAATAYAGAVGFVTTSLTIGTAIQRAGLAVMAATRAAYTLAAGASYGAAAAQAGYTAGVVIGTGIAWAYGAAVGVATGAVWAASTAVYAYSAAQAAGGIVAGTVSAAQWLLNGALTVGRGLLSAGSIAFVASSASSLAWATATGLLTATQWLLNIALSANPIGIVIGALGGAVIVTGALAGAAIGLAAGMSGLFNHFVNVSAVSTWFTKAFDVAKYAVSHLGETAQLVGAEIGLFAVRSAAQVAYAFTTQVPAYLTYLRENWRNIFTDIGSLTAATFNNLLVNAKNFGVAVWEAIKGNGFSFNWTPLTNGFRSAMSELPNIAERQVGAMENKLQGTVIDLRSQFAKNMQDWKARGGKDAADDAAEQARRGAMAEVDKAKRDADALIAKSQAEADAAAKQARDAAARGVIVPPLAIDNSHALDAINQVKGAVGGLDAVLSGSAESMRLAFGGAGAAKALKSSAADLLADVKRDAFGTPAFLGGKGNGGDWMKGPFGGLVDTKPGVTGKLPPAASAGLLPAVPLPPDLLARPGMGGPAMTLPVTPDQKYTATPIGYAEPQAAPVAARDVEKTTAANNASGMDALAAKLEKLIVLQTLVVANTKQTATNTQRSATPTTVSII